MWCTGQPCCCPTRLPPRNWKSLKIIGGCEPILFSVAPKPKLFGIFNKFDGVGPQCSSAHHHFTHAARFSSAYEMLHVELIFGSRKEKTQLESAASRLPNQCLVFCERDDIFRAFQKGRRGIVCFRIYCCNGLQQIMTVVKSFIAPAKRATYARGVALPQHLGSSDGMLNFWRLNLLSMLASIWSIEEGQF